MGRIFTLCVHATCFALPSAPTHTPQDSHACQRHRDAPARWHAHVPLVSPTSPSLLLCFGAVLGTATCTVPVDALGTVLLSESLRGRAQDPFT